MDLCFEQIFSVSLDTVESEGLTEGTLISCTSSKLSACESTDSRLFGVKADVDEGGLSIEVALFLDGIFDPSPGWIELLERNIMKETL